MYIVQMIDTLVGGGSESVCLSLAEGFTANGVDNAIIEFSGKIGSQIPEDIEVKTFECDWKQRNQSELMGRVVAFYDDILDSKGNDICVLCHLQFSEKILSLLPMRILDKIKAKVVLHVPFSMTRQDVFLEKPKPKLKHYFEFWRLPKVYRKSNENRAQIDFIHKRFGFIAVGPSIYRDTVDLIGCSDNIYEISNPISLPEISRRSCEACPFEGDFILHVARFSREKNHKELLLAYERSGVDVPLLLLGYGIMESQIKSLIKTKRLDGRVHIVGFVSNPFSYYRAARLVVLTSIYEGYPMCIVESLACGTPVLSYDTPTGPADILMEESPASIVPYRDVDEFSIRLKGFLAGDLDLRVPSVESNDTPNVVKKYLEILSS